MGLEQVRSFIAVELPDELKSRLERIQTYLKGFNCSGVKWVRPGGIHLTLTFLGGIPVDAIAGVSGIIGDAVKGKKPVQLAVEGTGVFPNVGAAQVAWVGIRGGTEELGTLKSDIDRRLSYLGFTPESRPFKPHLTLARVGRGVPREERGRFGRLVTEARFDAYHFRVDGISLMKSQLSREGAIYSRISLNRLGAG